MSDYEDYSTTAASNNDASKGGWPENMDRSDVNNRARENLAATRTFWDDPNWKNVVKDYTVTQASSTQITVAAVDATALFPVRTKVRIRSSSSATTYAFVTAVSYSSPDTTITVGDFDSGFGGSVPADCNGVDAFFLIGSDQGIGSLAFEDGSVAFEVPTTQDRDGIQAAVTAAESNGKIVLLESGTYTFENTDTPVAISGPVRIWGRGKSGSSPGTIVECGSTYDDVIFQIGNSANDVEIAHMYIDGNASTQTGGTSLIEVGTRPSRMHFHDLNLIEAYGHAIDFVQSTPITDRITVIMEQLYILSTGDHAIAIEANTGAEDLGIVIRDVVVQNPGSVGSATANAAALYSEATCRVDNMDIELGSFATAHGIHLSQSGSDTGAVESFLSGIRIQSSSGTSQYGIRIQSNRSVRLANSYVEVTGASAIPLSIDGVGGAPQDASEHAVVNSIFVDGVRNEITADALRNEIIGCTFRDQSAQNLLVDGQETTLSACVFENAGTNAVHFRAGSSDSLLANSRIRDCGADGVFIDTNADDVVLIGNFIDDTGGDGVDVSAASADRTVIQGNRFRSVAGSDISDSGTRTVYQHNSSTAASSYASLEDYHEVSSFSVPTPIATEAVITGLDALAFPASDADGTREYRVTASMYLTAATAAGTVTIRVRMGTAGTTADTLQHTVIQYVTTSGGENLSIGPFKLTPASSELLTFTCEMSAASKTIELAQVHVEKIPE